jgi:glycosyltransferase involved in cell wall biosynthesis
MTPAVSVVVATYNYGRYLAGALESVLAQTFTHFEVLVIDDGSTDDTPEVAARFRSDPRVSYVRVEHGGQPQAKNTGLRLARAPLVAFLDADDLWMPHKLERQLPLFESTARPAVVFSERVQIDAGGRPLVSPQPPFPRGRVLGEMFKDNFICFSSVVVRRHVVESVGLFDESLALAIDYDLWLRVAKHHTFDNVAEPLVKYRVGHANLSSRVEERLRTVLGIMDRFLDEQGGRRLLSPALVRRAYAETYCHLALYAGERSRWAAYGWLLRALLQRPVHLPAWHGLVSVPLPEQVRRWLRRALGRPVDWRVRTLAPPQPGGAAC